MMVNGYNYDKSLTHELKKHADANDVERITPAKCKYCNFVNPYYVYSGHNNGFGCRKCEKDQDFEPNLQYDYNGCI